MQEIINEYLSHMEYNEAKKVDILNIDFVGKKLSQHQGLNPGPSKPVIPHNWHTFLIGLGPSGLHSWATTKLPVLWGT